MPYPDRQNCWPYDEAPSLWSAVICTALIGMACVVGLLLWIF